MKRLPVAVSLLEDRQPAQVRLCAPQNQHFKQASVIVNGNAPFLIVIRGGKRISPAPFASALHLVLLPNVVLTV